MTKTSQNWTPDDEELGYVTDNMTFLSNWSIDYRNCTYNEKGVRDNVILNNNVLKRPNEGCSNNASKPIAFKLPFKAIGQGF